MLHHWDQFLLSYLPREEYRDYQAEEYEWPTDSFNIPRNKKGEKVKLILNGINYKAEIWFNRQLLGTMTGAFERGIFDITPWVDYDKKNLLAIRILPPNNPSLLKR